MKNRTHGARAEARHQIGELRRAGRVLALKVDPMPTHTNRAGGQTGTRQKAMPRAGPRHHDGSMFL
jgi:hypothetical protein